MSSVQRTLILLAFNVKNDLLFKVLLISWSCQSEFLFLKFGTWCFHKPNHRIGSHSVVIIFTLGHRLLLDSVTMKHRLVLNSVIMEHRLVFNIFTLEPGFFQFSNIFQNNAYQMLNLQLSMQYWGNPIIYLILNTVLYWSMEKWTSKLFGAQVRDASS